MTTTTTRAAPTRYVATSRSSASTSTPSTRSTTRTAVLEFPQSRERFEGLETFREWRAQYPGKVRLRPTRVVGDGDVWVGLAEISYEGGPWRPAVAVLEYRRRPRRPRDHLRHRALRAAGVAGAVASPLIPSARGPPSEHHV